jgi:hypothetical protein
MLYRFLALNQPIKNVGSHHAEKPLAFAAVRDIEARIRWYKKPLGWDPETQPMAGLAEG